MPNQSKEDIINIILELDSDEEEYEDEIEKMVEKSNKKYKNIVLSGGGLLGFSYLGFHKYITDNTPCGFENIENILGVSAGAIYSLYLACGLDYNIIKMEIMDMEMENILDITIDDIINIKDNKGIFDPIIIKQNAIKPLLRYDIDPNITFQQVYDKYHKSILIGVTNLSRMQYEIFGKENYPDMSVIDAVTISACVPIVFKPIIFNDMVYVDGGTINKFPLDFFDQNKVRHDNRYKNIYNDIQQHYLTKDSLDTTFGIILANDLDYIYPKYLKDYDIFSYFSIIFYLLCRKEDKLINDYKDNICSFEVPHEMLTSSKINFTPVDLDNAVEICYGYIEKFLS